MYMSFLLWSNQSRKEEVVKNMTIDMTFERQMELAAIEYTKAGKAEGTKNANITAVVNMLNLGVDEAAVKDLYPDEFEEGKKRYLEQEN